MRRRAGRAGSRRRGSGRRIVSLRSRSVRSSDGISDMPPSTNLAASRSEGPALVERVRGVIGRSAGGVRHGHPQLPDQRWDKHAPLAYSSHGQLTALVSVSRFQVIRRSGWASGQPQQWEDTEGLAVANTAQQKHGRLDTSASSCGPIGLQSAVHRRPSRLFARIARRTGDALRQCAFRTLQLEQVEAQCQRQYRMGGCFARSVVRSRNG